MRLTPVDAAGPGEAQWQLAQDEGEPPDHGLRRAAELLQELCDRARPAGYGGVAGPVRSCECRRRVRRVLFPWCTRAPCGLSPPAGAHSGSTTTSWTCSHSPSSKMCLHALRCGKDCDCVGSHVAGAGVAHGCGVTTRRGHKKTVQKQHESFRKGASKVPDPTPVQCLRDMLQWMNQGDGLTKLASKASLAVPYVGRSRVWWVRSVHSLLTHHDCTAPTGLSQRLLEKATAAKTGDAGAGRAGNEGRHQQKYIHISSRFADGSGRMRSAPSSS